MADYHVLTQSKELQTIDVVFHIPISGAGSNRAGIQWRNAVVLEQGGVGNIVSTLPNVTTQDKNDMESGAIIEIRKTVRFSSINLTNVERNAEVEAEFNNTKAEIVAEKINTLAFIGLEGTVT